MRNTQTLLNLALMYFLERSAPRAFLTVMSTVNNPKLFISSKHLYAAQVFRTSTLSCDNRIKSVATNGQKTLENINVSYYHSTHLVYCFMIKRKLTLSCITDESLIHCNTLRFQKEMQYEMKQLLGNPLQKLNSH